MPILLQINTSLNCNSTGEIAEQIGWLCYIRVGDSSTIAAGAVVNSDVSENTIVGGIPAKLIKQIVD